MWFAGCVCTQDLRLSARAVVEDDAGQPVTDAQVQFAVALTPLSS